MNGQRFRLYLRVVGTVALLAVVAVVMPYSWMNAIHQALGMGELSCQPVVGYLARSTSAFYVILGALLWRLSFNPPEFRAMLQFLGVTIVVFGVTLLVVDWCEGLPAFWKYGEGPINIILGAVILMGYRSTPAPPA
ncbi:MAG: hypothetical protein WCO56_19480 [Verrucomicrobiota bacterium]